MARPSGDARVAVAVAGIAGEEKEEKSVMG